MSICLVQSKIIIIRNYLSVNFVNYSILFFIKINIILKMLCRKTFYDVKLMYLQQFFYIKYFILIKGFSSFCKNIKIIYILYCSNWFYTFCKFYFKFKIVLQNKIYIYIFIFINILFFLVKWVGVGQGRESMIKVDN